MIPDAAFTHLRNKRWLFTGTGAQHLCKRLAATDSAVLLQLDQIINFPLFLSPCENSAVRAEIQSGKTFIAVACQFFAAPGGKHTAECRAWHLSQVGVVGWGDHPHQWKGVLPSPSHGRCCWTSLMGPQGSSLISPSFANL